MASKRAGSARKKKAGTRRPRSRKGRRFPLWAKRLLLWIGIPVVALGLVLGSYFVGAASTYNLETIRNLGDGGRLGRLPVEAFPILHGEKPIILPAEAYPEHLKNALIAREDSRFWRHRGIDFLGVARATLRNIEEKELREGAGTITMQVARTAYGFKARTLRRKIIEMLLAYRIERNFSKEEILAAYMNWVFLGSDNHGFEQASIEYLGKSARLVTLGEGAVLVGMLRAPNRFHPGRHYEAAMAERDAVLARMVDEGLLDAAEAEAEKAKGVRVVVP